MFYFPYSETSNYNHLTKKSAEGCPTADSIEIVD